MAITEAYDNPTVLNIGMAAAGLIPGLGGSTSAAKAGSRVGLRTLANGRTAELAGNATKGIPNSTLVCRGGTCYDSVGNMLSNSAVGSYTYPLPGSRVSAFSPGPHAQITAGSQAYTYDLNGNMVSGGTLSLAYATLAFLGQTVR